VVTLRLTDREGKEDDGEGFKDCRFDGLDRCTYTAYVTFGYHDLKCLSTSDQSCRIHHALLSK
jgi:hypothetical protein